MGGGWFIFHLKIKEVTFDVLFTIIKLRKLEIYPNCGNCKNACNTRDLVTCQMNKKKPRCHKSDELECYCLIIYIYKHNSY